jgi:hypothetical protein
MRRTHLAFLFLFLLIGAFFSSVAHAGSLRIALLEGVAVRGDVILLADLLPKDAPRFLHEVAAKISLGMAPQNGASRRLSSFTVHSALVANGFQVSAFQIPEVMTVQRASHLVTREQVFAAIRTALAGNRDAALRDFQPEDISFGAVLLPNQASRLEVTEISFDQFIGRARFRLWSPSARDIHPFYATAQLPPGQNALLSSSISPLSAGAIVPSQASHVLVEPSRSARLHLHSSNANILLEVKPLQRGRLGEIIRVRMPANGKTFRARVVEGGDLDAHF